jgi:hypothetical protein
MNKNLPVYDIVLNDDSQGVGYISLVDSPAIQVDWIKLAKARFNRLNSKEMKSVLEGLGRQDGKNLTERKKIFQEIVLDRKLGYEIIISAINKVKEGNGKQ